jgi:hypothetical protein
LLAALIVYFAFHDKVATVVLVLMQSRGGD